MYWKDRWEVGVPQANLQDWCQVDLDILYNIYNILIYNYKYIFIIDIQLNMTYALTVYGCHYNNITN